MFTITTLENSCWNKISQCVISVWILLNWSIYFQKLSFSLFLFLFLTHTHTHSHTHTFIIIYQVVVEAVHSGAGAFFIPRRINPLNFRFLLNSDFHFHSPPLPLSVFFMTLTANQESYVVTEVTQAILPEMSWHSAAGTSSVRSCLRRCRWGWHCVTQVTLKKKKTQVTLRGLFARRGPNALCVVCV